MVDLAFSKEGLEGFKNIDVTEIQVKIINKNTFFSLNRHDKQFKIHFFKLDSSSILNYNEHDNIFNEDLDSYYDETILNVDLFKVETPYGFLEFISGGLNNSFFYMSKKNQEILSNNSYLPDFLKDTKPFRYKGFYIFWRDHIYQYHDKFFDKEFRVDTKISKVKEHIDFIYDRKKYLNCDLSYYVNRGFTINFKLIDNKIPMVLKLDLKFPDGSLLIYHFRVLDIHSDGDHLKSYDENLKLLSEYAAFRASLYLLEKKGFLNTIDFTYEDFYKFKDLY